MTIVPDMLYHMGGVPVGGFLDVGNVYYVIQTTHPLYNTEIVQNKLGTYANDGSQRVHNTITTALAATVTNRNDYVLVMSDLTDYDEDATLTMNKNSVHLLCPAGLGSPVGCIRAATIDPNTSAHAITITGRGVEVAGFWIRGYAEKYCISIAGLAYGGLGCHIHHNDCAITSTSSSGTAAGGIVVSTTDGGSATYGTIAHNRVYTMAGTGATVVGGITAGYTSTWLHILGNHVIVGHGNTMTSGITNQGIMGMVADNYLYAAAASAGGFLAGTFTAGITIGEATTAINNRIGITDTSKAIVGGTAINCMNNYSSLDGGTIAS